MTMSSVNAGEKQRGNMLVKGSILIAMAGLLLTVGLQSTMISEAIQTKIDEKGDYENAARDQYRLALYCYYLMNTEHSRVLFGRVIEDFPKSEFVGASLYKMGQTWERKGNGREALLWFRRAVKALDEDDPLMTKAKGKARQMGTI